MNADLLLHTLLDSNLRRPSEYSGGLTNHLPMALHALRALGASDDRLRRFEAHYAARFGPLTEGGEAAPSTDWRGQLGHFEAFDALRAAFDVAVRSQGRDGVLRAALPVLMPGMAAAAFHGPIRTAHAVQSGHDGELAAALGY